MTTTKKSPGKAAGHSANGKGPKAAKYPSPPKSGSRSNTPTTQRLSPEEMDAELDRVNRANGNAGPAIAAGTHPDDEHVEGEGLGVPSPEASTEAETEAEVNGKATESPDDIDTSEIGSALDDQPLSNEAGVNQPIGTISPATSASPSANKELPPEETAEEHHARMIHEAEAENSGRLRKLKGVGKATAERLEESVAAWWKGHPEMVPGDVEAGKTDGNAGNGGETAAAEVVAAPAPAVKKPTRKLGMAGRPAPKKSAKSKSKGKSKAKKKSGGKKSKRPNRPR